MADTSASSTPSVPRGVRNCNPLNIEYSPKWQGLRATRTDDRFAEFITMAWGFRAAAVTLCTYQDKYGIDTIGQAVSRWAPSTENDTAAYIAAVCKAVKMAPDEKVNFHDFNDAAPIIYAMSQHENGAYRFANADLVQGCIKAGLENCPRGAVGAAGRAVAMGTGIAATAAANNPDLLQSAYNTVKPFVDTGPHILQVAFWCVVVVVGGAFALGEVRKYMKAK